MQPVSAFSFFSRWVKNQPFQQYVPKKGMLSSGYPGTEGTSAIVEGNSTTPKEAREDEPGMDAHAAARKARVELAVLKGQLASQERVWEKQREAMQHAIAQLELQTAA
jgi:hypothetical protein